MNRELVLLAKTLDRDIPIAGLYLSTKLDGQRAWWDGGITRGMLKRDIPWANNDKDERYKEPPVSTGLWTRYGNVVNAPASFLDQLPIGTFLDGELYMGRGLFQATRKVVSTLVPGADWGNIRYCIFDSPSPRMLFSSGKINNPQMTKYIHEETCLDLLRAKVKDPDLRVRNYRDTIQVLLDLKLGPQATIHEQVLLPQDESRAKAILQELLLKETALGGEGLMLRDPGSIWYPKRSDKLLKVKKVHLDEGIVRGFIAGEGKLQGMIGAVVVSYQSLTFNLSGFTDVERMLGSTAAVVWAKDNEGKELPGSFDGAYIKIGSPIRFAYMGLTDDGKPREPRYARR